MNDKAMIKLLYETLKKCDEYFTEMCICGYVPEDTMAGLCDHCHEWFTEIEGDRALLAYEEVCGGEK